MSVWVAIFAIVAPGMLLIAPLTCCRLTDLACQPRTRRHAGALAGFDEAQEVMAGCIDPSSARNNTGAVRNGDVLEIRCRIPPSTSDRHVSGVSRGERSERNPVRLTTAQTV
jgi:hypothetical protein